MARAEQTNIGWLPLNDYSAKYRISLSTLRRRIQSDEADFRFEGGKYWLADRPIAKHSKVHGNLNANLNESGSQSQPTVAHAEGILDSANHLLHEIKQAYISVLQEKESQIMQLKEEVVDLKTLVKILESENDRLRS